jgi:hypothetical protein
MPIKDPTITTFLSSNIPFVTLKPLLTASSMSMASWMKKKNSFSPLIIRRLSTHTTPF